MGKYDDVIGSINSTASAGGIIGGLISSIGAGRRQWKWYQKQSALNYEYQQKSADAEFNRQKEMWRLNNEYNSPVAQRQRLEEANMLGPALFDGSGPTEASMPSVSTPGSSAPGGMLSPMPGADNMARYVGIARQIAEINNINASTERTSEQSITERTTQSLNAALAGLYGQNTELNKVATQLSKVNLAIAEATKSFDIQLRKLSVDQACKNLDKILKEVNLLDRQGSLTHAQTMLVWQSWALCGKQIIGQEVRNLLTNKHIEYTDKSIDLLVESIDNKKLINNYLRFNQQGYKGSKVYQYSPLGLSFEQQRLNYQQQSDYYHGTGNAYNTDTPFGISNAAARREFKWSPYLNSSQVFYNTADAVCNIFMMMNGIPPVRRPSGF